MASIQQRGDQWFAQVRQKKDGTVVFSESKTFPTEAMARSWAERLEAKIKKDGPISMAQRGLTVGKLIEMHLEYQQKLRMLGRSTIHNHATTAQAFDKIKLTDLTSKHITDFVLQRKAEGAGPATILSNLSPLSAAIHAAPYAHGIHVDPTPVDLAIRKLKESGAIGKSKEIVRLVEGDEEDALLTEFKRRNHHHQTEIDMVLVYRLAIALPRRAGELTRLRWADVDFKNRTVLIRDVKHPRRKIGNDQLVPLLGEAFTIIEQIPKLGELILPYNTSSMTAAFERARDRIAETGMPKIADLRFHDLRHTGITQLFWAGLKIEEVATVSGHTNWAQLKRYTHIRPEDVHRRWDAMNPSPARPVTVAA
jgi:integrase